MAMARAVLLLLLLQLYNFSHGHRILMREGFIKRKNSLNSRRDYTIDKAPSYSELKVQSRVKNKLSTLYGGFFSLIGGIFCLMWKLVGFDVGIHFLRLVFTCYGFNLLLVVFLDPMSWVPLYEGARELKNYDWHLYQLAQRVAKKSKIPKLHKVWLVPSYYMNAYALGIDQRRAAIAVTTALRDNLSEKEFEAVIGHECGHIKNSDCNYVYNEVIVISAYHQIAVCGLQIVHAVSRFSRENRASASIHETLKSIWEKVFGRNRNNLIVRIPESNSQLQRHESEATYQVIGASLAVAGVIAILTSIVRHYVESRESEFKADLHGAEIAGAPALISALRKIQRNNRLLTSGESAPKVGLSDIFFLFGVPLT